MGIAVFRRLSLSAPAKETAFLLCAGAAFGGITLGWLPSLAGIITALLILLVRYTNPILDFFGEISYSLYLIHPFVASIVVNQGGKIFGNGSLARILLLTAAVAASVISAWALYYCLELPSKQLAASIRYHAKSDVEPVVGLRAQEAGIVSTG
jgi:peptidoglycan/LPS O-acetylase OafA/YrhL